MMKTFLTVREVSKTGILSEYALRLMLKSDNPPPHITINKKVMINYPLFIEWLDTESKKAVNV
ncbi:MAG: hypothetical protein E7555_09430 [Ruminococcaceae bacterium]|nr:hypothetical protein [Oscillospiraceae bacterium]